MKHFAMTPPCYSLYSYAETKFPWELALLSGLIDGLH